jgi:hypothetical protein
MLDRHLYWGFRLDLSSSPAPAVDHLQKAGVYASITAHPSGRIGPSKSGSRRAAHQRGRGQFPGEAPADATALGLVPSHQASRKAGRRTGGDF